MQPIDNKQISYSKGPAWHGLTIGQRGPTVDQLKQIEALLREAGARIRGR